MEEVPTTMSNIFNSWPVVTMAISLFIVVCRKYFGFYYRCTLALFGLLIMAIYGTFASLILPFLGKTGLINYSVARGYFLFGRLFCGINVVAEGTENLVSTKGPVIYVCNHQSSLDVMLMGRVYPKNTAIVAKKSLKYYPFLGWFMIMSNAIFLDRKNRTSAIQAAQKAAQDIHNKNTNVWIFPEGTRGHESEVTLLPFKKGAFHMAIQARVPIVPIVIANYSELYSTKNKRFIPGTLRCRVLPPITTEGVNDDSASIEKLATETREKMLIALKDITPVNNKLKNKTQ